MVTQSLEDILERRYIDSIDRDEEITSSHQYDMSSSSGTRINGQLHISRN
jgi:hypothetical protein